MTEHSLSPIAKCTLNSIVKTALFPIIDQANTNSIAEAYPYTPYPYILYPRPHPLGWAFSGMNTKRGCASETLQVLSGVLRED